MNIIQVYAATNDETEVKLQTFYNSVAEAMQLRNEKQESS